MRKILIGLLSVALLSGCVNPREMVVSSKDTPKSISGVKAAAYSLPVSPVSVNVVSKNPWMDHDYVLKRLRKLPSLLPDSSYRFYHWPAGRGQDWWTPKNADVAREMARICRTTSTCLHYTDTFDDVIAVAQDVPGCQIVIEYSPYHHYAVWREDPNPCKYWEAHAEMVTINGERLTTLKQMCDNAGVQIYCVVFDHELFTVSEDDEEWNACLAEKLTAMHRLVAEILPGTKIAWYAAPCGRGQGRVGPPVTEYHPSMYHPIDWDYQMRRYFIAVGCAIAYKSQHPDKLHPRIVPWLAFGGSYIWSDSFQKMVWVNDVDYPTDNDRRLARFLKNHVTPHLAILRGDIAMWPRPETPGGDGVLTPRWWQHFIAFAEEFADGADSANPEPKAE